jgi:hypothetical protein
LASNFIDLFDYYKTNFSLINYYKWSIEDIENMMFWEREIYINLLAEEKQKESQLKMSQQFGR